MGGGGAPDMGKLWGEGLQPPELLDPLTTVTASFFFYLVAIPMYFFDRLLMEIIF